jgi:hypothetical protein
MLRHIGWLCGFVVMLLMSWLLRASIPTLKSLPSAGYLPGALRSALLTPPQRGVAADLARPPRIRVGPATSTNWSGYVVTAPVGSVSDVTGSWVVPPVTCAAGETSYAAFWIGIDGDSSPTVEQIGTDSDCQNGVPTYYAWFEFFPFRPRLITTVPVAPGDVIGAEVTYNASTAKFEVFIVNITRGSTFAIARWFPGKRASAEWIAEAPAAIGGGGLPLANFGTVDYGADFTAIGPTNMATVNGQTGPIAAFGAAVQGVTMVSQSNVVKAQPSGLSPDGTSFSITWVSAGP